MCKDLVWQSPDPPSDGSRPYCPLFGPASFRFMSCDKYRAHPRPSFCTDATDGSLSTLLLPFMQTWVLAVHGGFPDHERKDRILAIKHDSCFPLMKKFIKHSRIFKNYINVNNIFKKKFSPIFQLHIRNRWPPATYNNRKPSRASNDRQGSKFFDPTRRQSRKTLTVVFPEDNRATCDHEHKCCTGATPDKEWTRPAVKNEPPRSLCC